MPRACARRAGRRDRELPSGTLPRCRHTGEAASPRMPARSCLADRRRFCQDTPVRLCKNRIQESHQFGRGQDSSYADPVRAPCFDHGPPGQPPAAAGGAASVPAGRRPAGLGTRGRGPRRAARQARLAGRRPSAGPGPLARHPGAAQARALADPVGAGPQRAAQFPAAGQVTAGPRAQREELVVARLIVVPPAIRAGAGNRSSGSGHIAACSGSRRAARTRSASRASWWPQRSPTDANGTESRLSSSVISYARPARSRQATAATDSTDPSTQRSSPITER